MPSIPNNSSAPLGNLSSQYDLDENPISNRPVNQEDTNPPGGSAPEGEGPSDSRDSYSDVRDILDAYLDSPVGTGASSRGESEGRGSFEGYGKTANPSDGGHSETSSLSSPLATKFLEDFIKTGTTGDASQDGIHQGESSSNPLSRTAAPQPEIKYLPGYGKTSRSSDGNNSETSSLF